MDIIARAFDAEHFASGLEAAGGTLTWAAQGNTHTLVLRGGFDDPLSLEQGPLLDALTTMAPDRLGQLLSGVEVSVTGTVHACLLPRNPVALFTYPITVTHAGYAVFACELSTDRGRLCVYVPNEYCRYHCTVPAQVNAMVVPVTRTRRQGGLFSRTTVTYVESYRLRIEPMAGYPGQGLAYFFAGCPFEYPITVDMLGKQLTVPAYTAPNGAQPPLELRGTESGGGYAITISTH